jgi:hypothetical protein
MKMPLAAPPIFTYDAFMSLFLMPRMGREELQRELEGMRKAAARRLRSKAAALATLREIGLLDDENLPASRAPKAARR